MARQKAASAAARPTRRLPPPAIQACLAQALQAYQSGNWQQVAHFCEALLAQDPANADAWHLLGLVACQQQDYRRAESCLRRAVACQPTLAAFQHNLGLVLHAQGRLEEAVACYEAALHVQPDAAITRMRLSKALWALGRLAEATAHYREVVRHHPEATAFADLGDLLQLQGHYGEAVACYQEALRRQPATANLYNNLGGAYHALGRYGEAIACYQEALRLQPACATVHHNLGLAHQACGALAEAAACYERALALQPDYTEAHNHLGFVLLQQGEVERALRHCREALRLRPDYAEAYNHLGAALARCGDFAAAKQAYETALRLQPTLAQAYANLGTLYRDQGALAEAVPYYRQALAHAPQLAEAHFGLALVHLQQGRLAEGWQGYEWRRQLPDYRPRSFPFVPWQGERFERGTLVVSAEQGLGDELLFASCLPDALEQVGHLVLECDPRLAPLLARSLPRVTVVGQGRHHTGWTKRLPAGTRHCPAGSLPRWLRPTLEAFFPQRLRLRAAPKQVRRWRGWLEGLGPGLKVGLSWRSLRRRTATPYYPPVALWQPVLRVCGVHFVSLQYDEAEADLPELVAGTGAQVHVCPGLDLFNDLEGTAGLLAALDLVIAPSNSTAVLAASLGRPVWCVLRHAGEWDQLGTAHSPWFSTLRVFRQPRPGDWQPVLEAMAQELAAWSQGGESAGREP
ncbi:MAG: hypothetical protein KatS3mg131_1303 [Candidatus Tectimicrobiota bacterium]|nr:MAG: hypothetical protein KatS3mg131_1303 [Candidatus Tectomicrobia bacterium]